MEDLDVRDWVTPGMLRVYFICTISLALQVNLKGIWSRLVNHKRTKVTWLYSFCSIVLFYSFYSIHEIWLHSSQIYREKKYIDCWQGLEGRGRTEVISLWYKVSIFQNEREYWCYLNNCITELQTFIYRISSKINQVLCVFIPITHFLMSKTKCIWSISPISARRCHSDGCHTLPWHSRHDLHGL